MSGSRKAALLPQNSDEILRLLTRNNQNVRFFDVRPSDGSATFIACDGNGRMESLIFVPRQAVRHLCLQFPYFEVSAKENLREPLIDAIMALKLVF